MFPIYLLPLAYTSVIFLVTQVIRKLLKIELTKSPAQKSKEEQIIDEEVRQLKSRRAQLASKDDFVEESLISRKINKLLQQKERMFKEENGLVRNTGNANFERLQKILRYVIENSFFAAIVTYLLLKDERIPVAINPDVFYPVGSLLGFHKEEGTTYFSLSLFFSYLTVRFCERVGHVVFRS